MDRVAGGGHRQVDDAMDVQITGDGIGADVIGLVRLLHMQGVAVGLRVDGHRGDAQFGAGTHDAHRDFTPVGDEDFADHGAWPGPCPWSGHVPQREAGMSRRGRGLKTFSEAFQNPF